MGLLDLFSITPHTRKVAFSDDKLKLTRQDIVDLVWTIDSLDQRQKDLIKVELEKELDDGGVSEFEYKRVVRRLAEKRIELGLSDVDVRNLKRILGQ